MRTSDRRGSALAVALIVIIMLMGMGIALATFSHPFIQRTGEMNLPVKASYAAEAALEKCWYEIATSSYNATGNQWLIANSGATPTGVIVLNNVPTGPSPLDPRVTVRGYALPPFTGPLKDLFYRFEATATWTDLKGATKKTTVASEYRARDTFARYMWFVDADSMNVGNATVKGHVHDNEGINFYYGGATFYKEVAAVDGFTYNSGANTGNTQFNGGSNPTADPVPMPNVNEIANLENKALSGYKFNGVTDLLKITFLGDQVHFQNYSQGGSLLSDVTLPLPSNGLIFVQGNFEVQGDMQGRVTVASMGEGTVTGDLRYVDADGDIMHQLFLNGTPVADNATANGVAWSEANGYTWGTNPDYNGDPTNPPAIGILTQGNIYLSKNEYNMELNAAIFTIQGSWQSDLTTVRGNLMVNGSMVSRDRGWRYQGGTGMGWGLSGIYDYDDNLLNHPPPFYLVVDKPKKGSKWIMNKNEVTNVLDL